MKRVMLMMMLVAAVGAVRAQEPPRPPVAPRPAQPPTDPMPAPRAPLPAFPLFDRYEQDALRERLMEAARDRDMARDFAQFDRDAMREQSARAAEMAREASRAAADAGRLDAQMAREQARVAMESMRDFAPMAPMPALPPMAAMAPMAPRPFAEWRSDEFPTHAPPAAWIQGDPADSLWSIARDAMNRGEYGRAAKLFSEITEKFPKSGYVNDSQYYEALVRYRIGTTEELQRAAKVLEPIVPKALPASTATTAPGAGRGYSNAVLFQRSGMGRGRNTSESEIVALYARINGALAQRGDRDAADKVAKLAAQAGSAPCDQDDIQLRGEALNALSQMDPAKATPILRGVLDRKDECSAPLRRNAVFMVGRRTDNESAALLLTVAKSDPNVGVRTDAINFLSRVPGDVGYNALEEILRSDQDERIQRSVIHSLMQSDNPRARTSMRALIDRKDAPVNLRIEAIRSFNSDHATADDAAYLRSLYGKAESDALKQAIIDAISRIGGPENDQWVLNLARNTNESSSMRAAALSRLSRTSSSISIADLGKLYDNADSQNMRQQIINILQNRKEPDAADKLVDIIRNGTDLTLRKQAMNALERKNDPRSTQLFEEILTGKKP